MDNEEKPEKQARNILKILVVDDDKTTTDLVKSMLTSAGYECSIENNSRNFFKIVSRQRFDLILLDVAMPGTSGIDILKRMKRDPYTKIVLFTAVTMKKSDIEKIKELGVIGIIEKPVRKEKMLEEVARFLSS